MRQLPFADLLLLLVIYLGAFAVPIVVRIQGSKLAAVAIVLAAGAVAAYLLRTEGRPRAE